MPESRNEMSKKRESIFLNERFMGAVCAAMLLTGLVSLYFQIREGDSFFVFEGVTKLVTATAMFLAFKYFKWDVAKGLTGGVLFCLMYQEAHFVLNVLWGEENFDTYLIAGVQGSLYLAAAGMAFLMTVIITINHFFISYASHGNPKNVILGRMVILFKFAVYVLLLVSNSQLGFSAGVLWRNAMQYLTDSALLLLLFCVESQFDSFNALRHELLKQKREGRKNA